MGYHNDGVTCLINSYTCMNGTPVADGSPGTDGAEQCGMCDPGHHINGNACRSNFYMHTNGITVICDMAAVGDTREINGTTYTKRAVGDIGAGNAATTCTSDITSLNSLFLNNTTFNADISSWDTSSVTNMGTLFFGARAFNQDISMWNTDNVTTMSAMFAGASSFNQDIGNWNTENVTVMSQMFASAVAFNQDISRWETGAVMNMFSMFAGATIFDQDISGWGYQLRY